ncbi:unnamed protein product [Angiostrongylus costaricensis]|uniref:EB domain-containing protein n=1 Tax=Angiostrongylus costaricensis TaxID=334426 RepID=A0A158PJP2_ANGCS|nr:unnamed protein product [Angiostrongylus costaricensis]
MHRAPPRFIHQLLHPSFNVDAAQQYTCPLASQQPVLTTQGINQFCTQPGKRDDCPFNALCLSASNSPNLFICCSFVAAQALPTCPKGGTPQPYPGGYKPCSLFSSTDCDVGYSCVRAVNDRSILLCCSTKPTQLLCPNGRVLLIERGRAVYCNQAQPQQCPFGYTCEEADGTPGTFVCCASAPQATCPAPYLPSVNAQGNLAGYTCQLSIPLAQYVCCGFEAVAVLCADGRKIYQQVQGQTYTCNPSMSQSVCPFGYECAPSTVAGVSVCCATNTRTESINVHEVTPASRALAYVITSPFED